MASHVFYSSTKRFTTPFSANIQGDFLLAFKNYFVWILYGNGQWMLFDLVKNQILNTGKIEGDIFKYSYIIRSPCHLGEKEIVFANTGLTKLQVLNPFENKYDSNWNLQTPTLQCVPQNERENDTKMTEATNDLNIVALQKSKKIAICEKKESNVSEYLVTVIQRDSQEKIQVVHSSNQKTYEFGKINETDKLILYEDYCGGSLDFAILDLSNPGQGFVTHSIGKGVNSSIINGQGWDKDTICLFGNCDTGGIPEMYLVDY